MRILIDECLNWRIGRALTGHYAVSAQKMGWSGITNGRLLALAVENGFDVFLTGDRNLSFQQNLTKLPIAVVVLEVKGIQLHHTLPLMPKVLELCILASGLLQILNGLLRFGQKSARKRVQNRPFNPLRWRLASPLQNPSQAAQV